MKQHITTSDLDQLNEQGKEKLKKWWKPEGGNLFIPTTDTFWVTLICRFEEDGFIYEDKWIDPKYPSTFLWVKYNKNDCLPVLSIGQMIEFLDPDFVSLMYDGTVMDEKLCDDLWAECVKTLNK